MKRVLLKLSGEALAGDKKTGFDEATVTGVASQVKELVDDGTGSWYRDRRRQLLERPFQREDRPDQG